MFPGFTCIYHFSSDIIKPDRFGYSKLKPSKKKKKSAILNENMEYMRSLH